MSIIHSYFHYHQGQINKNTSDDSHIKINNYTNTFLLFFNLFYYAGLNVLLDNVQ